MSTPEEPKSPPSAEFVAAFCEQAGEGACLPFDRFMTLALYHPTLGYYRADRTRVGYGASTDFFTATSTGTLFGELVEAACRSLLGEETCRKTAFVEIGAERGKSVLSGVPHSFAQLRTIGIGEPITLEGPCVVFSNELFDAQPFRRIVFRRGAWRELGVRCEKGLLIECELGAAASVPVALPESAPEGYVLDLPVAAKMLAQEIAAQPWSGLFLAFDYGKSWRELIEATPAGTARAYFRHRQSNDLLGRPGEQDLTCHICWDWLSDALRNAQFGQPMLETQEAFLIRRAGELMSRTVASEAAQLTQRKLALIQLLQNLGQKFQVLWALR
jgi:SAM-dependent MidA family methyltransferase